MKFPKLNIQGHEVTDIRELIDVFDVPEGNIESWTGRIGSGKTYGATRRVINDLRKGRVVMVNWKIDLTGIDGDDRHSLGSVLAHIVFFQKRFYSFDYKNNLHYYDLDDPTALDTIKDATNVTVYLDEGQDLFDSYEGTRMPVEKRKVITRTRHYSRTLVIISQRPQAIAVTARANVSIFHRHVKAFQWHKLIFFKVFSTEDIDSNNMPIFTVAHPQTGKQKMVADLTDSYFARKSIFRSYNSMYLRGGVERLPQFKAYDLNFIERFGLLFFLLRSTVVSLFDRTRPSEAPESVDRARP